MRSAFILLSVLIIYTNAWSNVDYAPKLILRTGFGVLNNEGTSSGSAPITGGFHLMGLYHLNADLAAGLGYFSTFDVSNGTSPVSGMDLIGRYYFWGTGALIKSDGSWGSSVIGRRWAGYTGLGYAYRTYFLGQDPLGVAEVDQLKGSYSLINILGGVDYRLNEKFGVNVEFVYSPIAFAASDKRVMIKELLVLLGFDYNF